LTKMKYFKRKRIGADCGRSVYAYFSGKLV
jgi:hypothetical protein